MEIVFKTRDVVVINKPFGMPSQKDLTEDPDAISLCSDLLKSSGEKSSLWLVHRLDRVVGGALVFARSKSAAAVLSEAIKERLLTKQYLAVVIGRPGEGRLTNYLFKDSKKNKSFVVDRLRNGVKEAVLEYRTLESVLVDGAEMSLVEVHLMTGRFHQIRAQLSYAGYPIIGDKKYGSRYSTKGGIALFAKTLVIEEKGIEANVQIRPPKDCYPWNCFCGFFGEGAND